MGQDNEKYYLRARPALREVVKYLSNKLKLLASKDDK